MKKQPPSARQSKTNINLKVNKDTAQKKYAKKMENNKDQYGKLDAKTKKQIAEHTATQGKLISQAEKLREHNEALAEKQKEFEAKAQEFQKLLSGEIDMDKVVLEVEKEQERLLERRRVV